MTQNIKGIRRPLLYIPIVTLFCIFILCKYSLPDYFVSESDLVTDHAILHKAFKTTYQAYDKYNGRYDHRCLEIDLANRSYFIRLTEKEKFWSTIIDPKNINKAIEVRYQGRLMDHQILKNPNEIFINNTLIYSYKEGRNLNGWFIIGVIIFLSLMIFLFVRALKKYRHNLLDSDNALWKESKLTLFKIWLLD